MNKHIYLKMRLFNLFISTYFLLILLVVTPTLSFGQDELGVYEHLDDYISNDLVFTDELYNEINLKESINKPTIISLVYYECPGICSPLLNGLADAMNKTDIQLGEDYQVYTISFSHTEKPPLAKKKKESYVKLVSHGDPKNSWKFFTGDSVTISRLFDQVGFKVKKEGKEYIHPGTLIVLSPKGKITRYLYGTTYFLPFDIKMAIVEAADEKSGPTINKMLKYCFSYDPGGQKYVLNFTKISGTFILLIVIGLLVTLVIKGRKKIKTQ